MITSSAGGLVRNKTAGLRDYREEVATMASGGNSAHGGGGSSSSGRGGAPSDQVNPAVDGTGPPSAGNDASTGANGPGVGGTHSISGTPLPTGTGAGEGTVRKGGRGGR